MEKKFYYNNGFIGVKKMEELIKKVIGVSSKDIILRLDRLGFNMDYLLILDLGLNFNLELRCGSYKPILWNTYSCSDDENKKHLAKLHLINTVINYYGFREDTIFKLVVVVDGKVNKVIKEGNYFDCIYNFELRLYDGYYDSLKYEFKGKSYGVEVIDNMNRYVQFLFPYKIM